MLMMLGSHQMVQAWGDVYLSICKDYPLSTAVQRCLGSWPCKAGEHISVPYITSSVATWEVKYTAWMGLAWPQYLPRYGHCVHKKFLVLPEENSYVLFIFQWSNWFSGSPLLLFLVEYQEYWWVRQQVPLSTISWSLLPHPLFKSFSLSLSTTKPLMRDLCPALHFIFIWTRSRLCQCSSRPGPLSSLIKFHSIVSWWMELRREALLCLVGFILLPFWAGLNCDQSQQNYDSIKTIS